MSEISSNLIYQGFWIDWSRGQVLGATITTTSTWGNIIIALATLLVVQGTDHLWNLVLFTLHQSRAAQVAGDGAFQQEQALLRSLPSRGSLLIDAAKSLWTWRTDTGTPRRTLHTLFIMAVALTFGISSNAASIFSSYLLETSNVQVLTIDKRCVVDIDFGAAAQVVNFESSLINAGLTYAEQCYGNSGEPSDCNIFVQPHIQVSLNQSSVCPLTAIDLCIASNPTSVVVDSGLLDSHHVFGINQPPNDRVFIRRRTTYAPIQVVNYTTELNSSVSSQLLPDDYLAKNGLILFNYGSSPTLNPLFGGNVTMFWSSVLNEVLFHYELRTRVSYADGRPSTNTFEPLSELCSANADVALCFILSSAIASHVPIDDPVFSAHHAEYCLSNGLNCTDVPHPDRNMTRYTSDNPAGVVVAQQQYQACLNDGFGKPGQCTDLTSSLRGHISDLLPFANENQQTTLNFLATMAYMFDLDSINTLKVVQAGSSLVYGWQTGIPPDQWVTEVLGWESFIWAAIQNAVARHSIGYGNSTIGLVSANSTAHSRFCASQKVVKPGGFANINVFGMSFVVAMSMLLMTADFYLLKIAIYLSKSHRLLEPRIQRWIQDGVLQLQRRAYEAEGYGPWQRLDEEVPVLPGGRELPTLFTSHHLGKWDVPMATPMILSDTIDDENQSYRVKDESDPNSHRSPCDKAHIVQRTSTFTDLHDPTSIEPAADLGYTAKSEITV